MPYELSGFEFIALDRLTDRDQQFPFDPRVMEALEIKGLITSRSDAWSLTNRGRALVIQIMGSER